MIKPGATTLIDQISIFAAKTQGYLERAAGYATNSLEQWRHWPVVA
jgi:hypothetical protein